MTSAIRLHVLAAVALTGLSLSAPAQAQQATMSFFVTSVGKGNGADLGGLAGADAHCQALAKAAGSTETNWRAYLSTTEPGGVAGVNARDRIGKGPWQNAKGVVVAKNVEDLHSDSNNINKQTALTENGEIVSGRGDAINMHDILTGSDPQGLYEQSRPSSVLGLHNPYQPKRRSRSGAGNWRYSPSAPTAAYAATPRLISVRCRPSLNHKMDRERSYLTRTAHRPDSTSTTLSKNEERD